uniref:Uncharacterized protein n=1 Tax=Klebsiella pneumoniae TaxID=573 RepID=A0A8B0SS36_KLEPN|nr:hypothetical protein [Klebsiella pneumoniae]
MRFLLRDGECIQCPRSGFTVRNREIVKRVPIFSPVVSERYLPEITTNRLLLQEYQSLKCVFRRRHTM